MSSAGDYNLPFILEERLADDDGQGGETNVRWSPVRTLWARLETLRATERFHAGGTKAIGTHRVRTHYAEDVLPDQRLALNGRIFHILGTSSPDPEDPRSELELMVKEAPN